MAWYYLFSGLVMLILYIIHRKNRYANRAYSYRFKGKTRTVYKNVRLTPIIWRWDFLYNFYSKVQDGYRRFMIGFKQSYQPNYSENPEFRPLRINVTE